MIAFLRDNDQFEQAGADVIETHNVLLYLARIRHARFSTRDRNNITAWLPSKTGFTITKVRVGH